MKATIATIRRQIYENINGVYLVCVMADLCCLSVFIDLAMLLCTGDNSPSAVIFPLTPPFLFYSLSIT